MIWMISLLLLFLGVSMAMTPYIAQRGIVFGVTLPEESNNSVKQLKKQYFFWNFSLSIIMTALFLFFSFVLNLSEQSLSMIMVLFISLQLVFGIMTYYVANKRVMHLKETLINSGYKPNKTITLDLNYHDSVSIFPTWILITIQVVIIAFEIILTIKNQAIIPDKIIMQWDFQGHPTRIVDKTMLNIYMMPIVQIIMAIIFIVTNESYKRGKQRVMDENSVKWSQKYRRISSYIGAVITVLVQLLMLCIQMTSPVPLLSINILNKLIFIILGFMLLSILGLMVIYGQGGSRLERDKQTPSSYDDDKYWKWGMFYFNRNDPSFWVEKRMGIGMTINLANWKAVAFVVVPIVFILGITFLIQ